MAYISLAQYAEKLGKDRTVVFRKVQNGSLPAVKIGKYYAIEENTPYTDERVRSGKYIDSRKK